MKLTKIPMGYDAREHKEDLKKEAEYMIKTGLFDAGFDTVILEQEEAEQLLEKCEMLHELGLKAGLTADGAFLLKEADTVEKFDYLEIEDSDDKTVAEICNRFPKLFVTVVCNDEEAKKGLPEGIDAFRITQRKAEDFFDLTRNILDSCRGNGKEDCNSYPSESRERATMAVQYKALCIPASLEIMDSYDKERMYAILTMCATLKMPVFLETPPTLLTEDQIEELKNPDWIRMLNNAGNPGSALRYYDPWHVLFERKLEDETQVLLIFNRCHGDTETTITSEDIGLSKGTDFTLTALRTGETVSSDNGIWNIHVITSDRPDTPCCMLYGYQAD